LRFHQAGIALITLKPLALLAWMLPAHEKRQFVSFRVKGDILAATGSKTAQIGHVMLQKEKF